MKWGIVGNVKSWAEFNVAMSMIAYKYKRFPDSIISGGSLVLDTHVVRWTVEYRIPCKMVWARQRTVLALRESRARVVNECDVLIIFSSETGIGTWSVERDARAAGKEVIRIRVTQ